MKVHIITLYKRGSVSKLTFKTEKQARKFAQARLETSGDIDTLTLLRADSTKESLNTSIKRK